MRSFLALIAATLTAMLGYSMHGSVGFAILDFFLWPLVWVKWIVLHQVTLAAIKTAFAWFLA